jgi:hypothetical protein
LLNWNLEGVEEVLAEFLDAAPHDISDLEMVMKDDELKSAIQAATQARVHRDILEPAGLYAVRVLAACLLGKGDGTVDPHHAIDGVLEAMRHRIGDRPGEWLNSLALIGKRLAGKLYSGEWAASDTFYRNSDSSTPHKSQPSTHPSIPTLIDKIFDVDGARVLSEDLKCDRQQRLLWKRLRKYGEELTLTIIMSVVHRHMIDGGEIGSIRDWRYFDGALEDACRIAEMEAMGARPGDVLGMHRAAMKAGRGA